MRRLSKAALFIGLISITGQVWGYTFPESSQPYLTNPEIKTLDAISQGVSAIAEESSQALVFVSVEKTVTRARGQSSNPLDWFFGPFGAPPQGQVPPHGRNPRQPDNRKSSGLGSGFFVDLDKGYVMTNNHVIEGADTIRLKLANGATVDGKLVGSDPNTDVAIIEIKEKFQREGLKQLTFANSSKARVGDFVVALGAPFGLEASLSFGIVSATSRGNLGITEMGNFIQTDAAINPGNSGGPLLNTKGQVLGVNTAIFSRSGAYAGIGFAVPANLAQQIGIRLVEDGKIDRGYIGAGLQPINPDLMEQLELKSTEGALVSQVKKNGPAQKGGLQAGDVILEVDGKKVKSPDDVVNTIGLIGPKKKIDLNIIRDGDEEEVTIKTGEWPNQLARAGTNQPESTVNKSGLAFEDLTAEKRKLLGVTSEAGALVTFVEPGSAADRNGIRRGDVIVSAGRKKVETAEDLESALKSASKKNLMLRIERAGDFFFVALKPSVG